MAGRNGSARWQGDLQSGSGTVAVGDGVFEGNYSFKSRFEDGPGTNPEQLIAAAHAACFTMAFSFACDSAGFETVAVDTQAAVRLAMKGGGFLIERIDLHLEAKVHGIDAATFQKLAAGAKQDCPLSKALASVPEITLTAVLRP